MTTITISGPGQTFDDEYCIILKALKDAGFEVIEDNEYPPNKEHYNNLTRLSLQSSKVKLVAKHQPWGG